VTFASRSHNRSKQPEGRSPEGGYSASARKEAPRFNPLWQSIAIRPGSVQAKLTIGQADDPYEREADRIADHVMRIPDPQAEGHGLSITPIPSQQAQRDTPKTEDGEIAEPAAAGAPPLRLSKYAGVTVILVGSPTNDDLDPVKFASNAVEAIPKIRESLPDTSVTVLLVTRGFIGRNVYDRTTAMLRETGANLVEVTNAAEVVSFLNTGYVTSDETTPTRWLNVTRFFYFGHGGSTELLLSWTWGKLQTLETDDILKIRPAAFRPGGEAPGGEAYLFTCNAARGADSFAAVWAFHLGQKVIGAQAKTAYNWEFDARHLMQEADGRLPEWFIGLPYMNKVRIIDPPLDQAEMMGEEENLQRKESSGAEAVATAPPIVHQALNLPGQPLETETRAYFEPRFGYDFSGVRVHTGRDAISATQAVRARAFTLGDQIAFASGQYAPRSETGRRLLAHELTHVAQQRGGTMGSPAMSASSLEPEVGPNGHATEDDSLHRPSIHTLTRSPVSKVQYMIQRAPNPGTLTHFPEKNRYSYTEEGKTIQWLDAYVIDFLSDAGWEVFRMAKAKGYSTFAAMFIVAHAAKEGGWGEGNFESETHNLFSVMGGDNPKYRVPRSKNTLKVYGSRAESFEAYIERLGRSDRWPSTVEPATGLFFQKSFTPDDVNKAFNQFNYYMEGTGYVYNEDPASDYGWEVMIPMRTIAGPLIALRRKNLQFLQELQRLSPEEDYSPQATADEILWITEMETAYADLIRVLADHEALKKAGKITPKK